MNSASPVVQTALTESPPAGVGPPRGRHTWELLDLFPRQGEWTIEDYLDLRSDRLVELSGGVLEVLTVPDGIHQDIALWLCLAVQALLTQRGRGVVRMAPFPVKVSKTRFREPDVCVLLDENDPRFGRKFWRGADIAIEVVSPDDPDRDYIIKRREYARAGIAEYWIVDPRRRLVRQLVLDGRRYHVAGTFRVGDSPSSRVLDGWTINVAACMTLIDRMPTRDEPLS